jgi:tRNA A-37 threonylcarbamoyl transferase component Bud32/tetratricopeptide (TPR) repeat protein
MTNLLDQLTSSLSGTYTIEREIGGGGMSRVFVAQETRLNRRVVVKVLAPELAAGISAERFEREIQLAASLLQANIVPVLSTGESHGLPYYTMPYVEGESLRARLGRAGGIPAADVPGILRDVARALAFAHERGVVHRDIKPDNVLLSGGAAVVTDFGIAKAIAAARGEAGATLTQIGTSIGTPAYMAPEQAAGDPNIDHRADIYAFGCMAYELLAGQPPFFDRSPQRMLAAHLAETPKPLLEVAPLTTPALATLIMRCLEKDANDRVQSASEIVRALDAITSGTSNETLTASLLARPDLLKWALAIYLVAFIIVAVVAKAAIVGIGLPDWVLPGAMIVMGLGLPVLLFTGYAQSVVRRVALSTPTLTPGGGTAGQGTFATIAVKASPHLTWKRSAIFGAAGLGLFVLLIGAFMALRAAGIGPFGSLLASGKLQDNRVLIGEFKATSTDSGLGDVVAEAVRADLAQSSALDVVSPQAIATVLARMQRPAATKLDSATAHEVAIRDGIPAIVGGDIHGLGAGYVVTVRLVTTDSGKVLASFSEAADGPKDLIPTLGKITRKLRGKVGESFKHLQATPRLETAATSSLDALRKYTEGVLAFRQFDYVRAVHLFDEAIALDSNFAGAYRSAAIALNNGPGIDRGRAFRYSRRAFELSDRLPEAERYQTRGAYYSRVDPAKSFAEYEALIKLEPRIAGHLNSLAVVEWMLRDLKSSEAHLRRAVVLDSTGATAARNLTITLLEEGDLAGAESALRNLRTRFPDNLLTFNAAARVAVARRDADSAIAILLDGRTKIGRDAAQGVAINTLLDQAYVYAGRLDEAQVARDSTVAAQRRAGTPGIDLTAAAGTAMLDSWYGRPKAPSLHLIDSALAHTPIESLDPEGRPYGTVALALALSGAPQRGRAVLERSRTGPDASNHPDALVEYYVATSFIDYTEGKFAEGIRAARAADIGTCRFCSDAMLGLNFDGAGQADSAIAAYTRFVSHTVANAPLRAPVDRLLLAGSYKRLGELLEARGNSSEALKNYEVFLRMWKHADRELRPQVIDVQKRVDRLRKKGG